MGDSPLDEELEVVTPAGAVNGVHTLRVLDVLNHIPQLGGGIKR